MLVSATEMINKAHEGHYAIAQFNINNMEWIKAILLGCEAKKIPSDPRCIGRCCQIHVRI